jgi:LPS export ABC transporter protein LptC
LSRVQKLLPRAVGGGKNKPSSSAVLRLRTRGRQQPRHAARVVVALAMLLATFAPNQLAVADDAPQLDVNGMTFVASRENNDAVILRAVHATFDTAGKLAHLRDVDASIPSSAKQRGFTMECDIGVVDLATNDFKATGNVKGRADSGEEFEAEWVRYDHAQGVLFTDAPVLITDRGTTFRGGGFHYDIAKRSFQLVGGAQVVQDPAEVSK